MTHMSKTIRLRRFNKRKNRRSGVSWLGPTKPKKAIRPVYSQYGPTVNPDVLLRIAANAKTKSGRYVDVVVDGNTIIYFEDQSMRNRWIRWMTGDHRSSMFRPGKKYTKPAERKLRRYNKQELHKYQYVDDYEPMCMSVAPDVSREWI